MRPHAQSAGVFRTLSSRLKAVKDRRKEWFMGAHAARVARETRKVLRLTLGALWDLREHFRVALDECSRRV